MNIFNLPDLGEGLPDAEIHEWHVKIGDTVKIDQPLVSMETAKAVVDVPSPYNGVIEKFFGQQGDVIKTGQPLVAFSTEKSTTTPDKGTVVGQLEESAESGEDNFIIGSSRARPKATAAVKMLAKKQGILLDDIKGSGDHGMITRQDIEAEMNRLSAPLEGYEPIRGARRAMLNSMVQSHQQVVPVSLFDEVDIHHWNPKTDITVRLIRAVLSGCEKEPALNTWFDTARNARKIFQEVNLGLAIDSEDGLFVPVINHVAQYSDQELRKKVDEYKKAVQDRSILPEQLKGATILLSNFGKFAGRFATPIIVPPMVAILAVGRVYEGVVSQDNKIERNKMLPLSLTFDHRVITGGEATRFLGAVIESLQKT